MVLQTPVHSIRGAVSANRFHLFWFTGVECFIWLCWLLNLDSFPHVRWGKCLKGFRLCAVLERKKKKKKKRKKKSRPEVACQIPDHHELTLYHRSIPLAQSCVVWSRTVDNFCTGCPRTNLHNIASRCNYHKNSAEEQLLDIHQTVNFSGRPCICLISGLFFFFPLSPLTRWVWCLYHCVLRKRHAGAVYRRDCRRSDWLWIPGYYTHLVLLSSGGWCLGTGNGKLLLACPHTFASGYLLHNCAFYSSASHVMSKGVDW